MEFLADIKNLMLPEVTVFIGILLLCLLSFVSDDMKKDSFWTALGVLILSFCFCLELDTDTVVMAFGGSFLISKFTVFFKEILLLGCAFTMLLGDKYLRRSGRFAPEFFMLLLTATLGGMVLVSARDFVTMFVSLEMLSISSYILSGFFREEKSSEALIKYLVTGSISSAVMLFGVSLLYALSGSLRFDVICVALKSSEIFNIASFAGIFVMAGLCFKLAAVPFYNWASDVYENSPLAVACFISTVSKIAGFGIIIRLIAEIFNNLWSLYLVVGLIALLSMTVGNFLGLCETNIKKIMAYSSIAQAGYILSVISLGSPLSLSSAIFYIVSYLLMNFAAWCCIEVIDNKQNLVLSDLTGMAYTKPYLALCVTVAFASLAGLPFFVGFFAKFYLFQAIAFSGFYLYPFLAVVLFNTIVALFYYLRIIKTMFDEDVPFSLPLFLSKKLSLLLFASVVLVILSGIFSAPFITYSQEIAQAQTPAVIKYEQIKGTVFDTPEPVYTGK